MSGRSGDGDGKVEIKDKKRTAWDEHKIGEQDGWSGPSVDALWSQELRRSGERGKGGCVQRRLEVKLEVHKKRRSGLVIMYYMRQVMAAHSPRAGY
jgi:hypothetical protein